MGVCCAFDGSDMSMKALEAAALFVRFRDDVHALFCSHESSVDESRCQSRALEVVSRKQLPNFSFHTKAIDAAKDVAPTILEYVDREVCGLICIGTRHTVEGDKRSIGRMTDALVRTSYIPICVIRPCVVKERSRRFLVAVDGTSLAGRSVEFVLAIARNDDEVIVFTINEDRSKADEHLAVVRETTSKLKSECRRIKFTQFSRNRDIAVAEDICKAASAQEADFIVLSTGWKRKDELGSVSTYCIYHADCHLLIYKNQAYLSP